MMKAGAAAAFVVVLLFAGALGWVANGLFVPAGSDATLRTFEVARGESLRSVARRLAAEGFFPDRSGFSPRVFIAYARYRGDDRAAKSGEYELTRAMTPAEILARLVAGNVKTYPVTVPEGLRLDEVATRMEAAGIVSADAFIAAARDPVRARGAGIAADGFEGYLYPETYRFRRNTPANDVVERMFREFESRLTDEDREKIAKSSMSLHETVTLASIVEKETAAPAERHRIAAVFHNRLKRRMLLQSDPTVIYGVIHTEGRFDGDIRWRDLKNDNPYNTYTRAGLPHGPIASPTVESIRAVLAPEDVPYLYFVSRNDGTHTFSRTLTEHNRAVNQYQRRRRPLNPS